MAKQELGPNQLKWIEALESGRYEQGRSCLCKSEKYCCLGVACRTFGIEESGRDEGRLIFEGECQWAPLSVIAGLGLRSRAGEFADGVRFKAVSNLTDANDLGKATFSEIAAFCREHPEAVFTEPR